MPELPEVETLRIQLNQYLLGLTIRKVEILKVKSFKGEGKQVIGAKIVRVQRFGKMLVLVLDSNFSLVIHLKLTGQLIYRGERQPAKIEVVDPMLFTLPNKHTRVIVYFTSGDKLFFNDMRIFGWMKIVKSQISNLKSQNLSLKLKISDVNDLVENLGPEPFAIDGKEFYRIIHESSRPIKIVLMDQEKISGVGNIYANDALFLSGIHPKTPASNLSSDEAIKLHKNLVKILKDAIRWRGASEQHFRDALGQMGEVQKHFYVYQKDGENCPNGCGEKKERMNLGGRGTFFCPKCQKYSN